MNKKAIITKISKSDEYVEKGESYIGIEEDEPKLGSLYSLILDDGIFTTSILKDIIETETGFELNTVNGSKYSIQYTTEEVSDIE